MAEREDGLGVETFCVDEELIRCLGVKIKTRFARFALAVAIAAIFQRKDIGGSIAQEFVGRFTVGNIGGVSVER